MLWYLLPFLAISASSTPGRGCTGICVFSNPNLRFGNGAETSVNAWGLFVQPWYFSHTANQWYKLTYSSYPLDTAIGTGTGSPNWSGANIVDFYSMTPITQDTDYSEFIVDSDNSYITNGHGRIVATRTFTVLGQLITFRNTFSLGANDSFVKINSQVTNNNTAPIENMIMWVGTRDDFVGLTDSNIKTRGNLNTGSFVAVTANEASRAIMITNTNEGVLFYSETPGVMTAYAYCCSFSNVYNTNPLSLAPATSYTDGSYAAVLPLGNLAVGQSSSITWYYAAGAIQSLSAVAENVAAAQVADAPVAVLTASASPSSSSGAVATHRSVRSSRSLRSLVASVSAASTSKVSESGAASETVTAYKSESSSVSSSISPFSTAIESSSSMETASASYSFMSPSASESASPSYSFMSSSASESSSAMQTPLESYSPSASSSASESSSAMETPLESYSPSASSSGSSSVSISVSPTTPFTPSSEPTSKPFNSFINTASIHITYSGLESSTFIFSNSSSASWTSPPSYSLFYSDSASVSSAPSFFATLSADGSLSATRTSSETPTTVPILYYSNASSIINNYHYENTPLIPIAAVILVILLLGVGVYLYKKRSAIQPILKIREVTKI